MLFHDNFFFGMVPKGADLNDNKMLRAFVMIQFSKSASLFFFKKEVVSPHHFPLESIHQYSTRAPIHYHSIHAHARTYTPVSTCL